MNINKSKTYAIICMLISALSFSLMQFCVKLTKSISLMDKIFVRNIFSLLLAIYIIRKRKLSFFGKKENQKYLFARSIGGLLGVILFFYGTMLVNLADAAIINKLSTFVVLILAHFFLKEKIYKYHVIAILLSILGAFFVIRPRFNSSIMPYMILLISAILSGIAFTSLRALGDKEDSYTIVFHYSLISSVVSLPFLIINFDIKNLKNALFLICVGIFACIGQVALTKAYKFGKASDVSIYDYSNIIFSTLLGYFFLKEIPDVLDFIGGAIIIFSSFIVYYMSKKKEKPY